MNKRHSLRNSNFWCLICVTVLYAGDTSEKRKNKKVSALMEFTYFWGIYGGKAL